MVQTLLHPYSASVLMATALVAVVVFTVAQVVATVPVSVLNPIKSGTTYAVTKEDYFGVISWVSPDSIRIIDSYGVSRLFSIDDSTSILRESATASPQKYSDIRIFDHVRISALKSGADVQARSIEIQ